jgi:hypothetical protein
MDHIFRSFLERNYEMGMALARDSDLLELTPVAGNPPHKYAAEYFCKGLVRAPRRGSLHRAHLVRAGRDISQQC